MANPIRVLVVSDLHAGSDVGLWPDKGMPMPDGTERPLNSGQKHLLSCWRHLTNVVKNDIRPDIVVVNGDLLDGDQRKSAGTEAVTTILPAQQKAAIKLLEPLTGSAKEVYVTRGTPYHDGLRGMNVELVADQLGAVESAPGWHSWNLLDLEINGVVLNIQHGISASSGLYRATALDREGIWSALAGKDGKVPKADAVVRSHVHSFVAVQHPSKWIVVTPCWQLQTEYMRKNSAYRMLPDIGAVILDVDPSAKKKGEDPINLRKLLYSLPVTKPITSKVGGGDNES